MRSKGMWTVVVVVVAVAVAVWAWTSAARDEQAPTPTPIAGTVVHPTPAPTRAGQADEPTATTGTSGGAEVVASRPSPSEVTAAMEAADGLLRALWTFGSCADDGLTGPKEAATAAAHLMTPDLAAAVASVEAGTAWSDQTGLCAAYTGPGEHEATWSVLEEGPHDATSVTLEARYYVGYQAGSRQTDDAFGDVAIFTVTMTQTPAGWVASALPGPGLDQLPARTIG